MKTKDYEKKRKELKEEKRELSKTKFDSVNIRKKRINDVNRTFRSLKRSEKEAVKKEINKAIDDRI